MVEVILLERIERLGQMGDVVNVRPGYARNFLLPQHKALRATKANLAVYETRKAQLVADNLKRKEEAAAVAGKMDGLKLTLVRQAGESGQLYGSVSARDLSDAATAAGYTVNKAQVIIEKPIKTTGIHVVRVALHPEVSVEVRISVAPTQDEADAQLRALVGAPKPDAAAAEEPSEDQTDAA